MHEARICNEPKCSLEGTLGTQFSFDDLKKTVKNLLRDSTLASTVVVSGQCDG